MGDETIYQPANRFLALIFCLVALAVFSGCATGGGNWDQHYDRPVEATRLSLTAEIELMARQYWASVYGMEVEDLMGPFVNEPDGLPIVEAVYLGPYFPEDVPGIPEEPYSALIFLFSMSHSSGGNPPGFGTCSLLITGGNKDFVLLYMGIHYGEGRKAGGETAREGPTRFSDFGLDVGFRGYLTPVDSRVGVYLVMGGVASLISWSRTPTSEEADYGEIIFHEGSGETPNTLFYAGLGATLLRAKAFDLGVIATYGTRFFDHQEMSMIERELFDESQGEYKLGVEVIVPF
jgi:hypothetical protein